MGYYPYVLKHYNSISSSAVGYSIFLDEGGPLNPFETFLIL